MEAFIFAFSGTTHDRPNQKGQHFDHQIVIKSSSLTGAFQKGVKLAYERFGITTTEMHTVTLKSQ